MKIAHICLYPGKDQKHISESGVASYTKNLLTNMPSKKGAKHFVLCSRAGQETISYKDGQVTVIRCFDKNFRFALQLHKELKKLNPDVVHIQHELSLFGGLLTAYLLPVLIFLWRKKTTITLHGVVSPSRVNKAFVAANNYNAPVWAVRLGLRLLYWPLAHWPKHVVVHEAFFKHVLVTEYGASPASIAVIAHGVEAFEPISKTIARRLLKVGPRKDVVLFMGYAAGYKGIDLLIEGFARYAKSNPNAYLIIGAGVHPKLKDDPTYQITYVAYQEKAERLIPEGQYRWVGFIPEDQVSAYYCAADVSVYPYTLALSSSGPMAFAIGNNRPFLASEAFNSVFAGEFIFGSTPKALAGKLQHFFAGTEHFDERVAKLRAERLWSNTSLKTMDLYEKVGA